MKWGLALGICALVACRKENEDVGASGSARAAASTSTAGSKSNATGSVSAAPSASTSAAVSSAGTLTKEAFCERATKLGDTNMGKCPDSEKANVPAMGHVKHLSSAKKECSIRVDSPKVEYHGDVAQRCIEAAEKRGGKTTFFTFDQIPECNGVLTGKAGEGQPAVFAEECAPGVALLGNRCVKPAPKDGSCEEYPGGLLGKVDEHPRCEAGLECLMTRTYWNENPPIFNCVVRQAVGDHCKVDLELCARGSACYQGKCKEQADVGGQCMTTAHCRAGLGCEIKGGVFGTCVAKPAVVESCGTPAR